jgi:hypothetical protein
LICNDRVPVCAVAVVIAAVPAPEQLGVTVLQRPDGVGPVWFSKPSQRIAVPDAQPEPTGVVVVVVVEVGGVLPLQDCPFTAKSTGVSLVPEYVAWKPKLTEPPVGTAPL